MAALRLYWEKIHYLSTCKITKQRKEIFRNINRDAFFPLNTWLSEMRLLFCCSPDLIFLCSLLPNFFNPLLLSRSFHLRNQQGSTDATIFHLLPWWVKIYLVTKIYTKVTNWWPTDLWKKAKEKCEKFIHPWLNYWTDKHTQTVP